MPIELRLDKLNMHIKISLLVAKEIETMYSFEIKHEGKKIRTC